MPGASPACGLVALVEGHEVFDVGSDEGPADICRDGEYLFVGESREGRIFDHGNGIVVAGTKLSCNLAAQHLVEKDRRSQ